MTERDFYLLVLEQFVGPQAPDYWGQYSRREITHFEAMRSVLAHAPADPGSLSRLLDAIRPEPLLKEAVDRLRGAGWDVIVVSAGAAWYIDRVLERAGVTGVTVHANPARPEPGRGLVLEMPERFASAEVGIDKLAVVRDAMARYERVAFAGDGPPDLPAALAVDARLRFARGWLARELSFRGDEYRPFERWADIARQLTIS